MRRDEALVFKVYDSEKDGRARFTPHTSFDDPLDAAGRAAAPEHRGAGAGVFLDERRLFGFLREQEEAPSRSRRAAR